MESDATVNAFVHYWKGRNFDGWNEMDVREDFLAPLLGVLGYSKNSMNDIVREASFGLSKLYHRIGRKEIEIDYIPTLRLKRFWIIEAKKASDYKLDTGDLLQAHFYAIHPSVQARYIVLTNGRELRLYDTYQLASTDDSNPLEDNYLLICRQDDCETTFPKLYRFLSAKTMLASIRDHIVLLLRETLAVEIDEDVPDQLRQKLMYVTEGSKQQIQRNAREVNFKAWQEFFEKDRHDMESYSYDTLLALMNIPSNEQPGYGQQAAHRIISANSDERVAMVGRLRQLYTGRPHSVFRVHSVTILIMLAIEGIEIPLTVYTMPLMAALEELVLANMSYWSSNGQQFALVHLDNTTLRVAKKLCMRFAMQPIQDHLQYMRQTLPREDFLSDLAGVSGRMVATTNMISGELWRRYYLLDEASIWKGIWAMEILETLLERIPAPKYPEGDSDLLYFEYSGQGLDILSLGTHGLLRRSRAELAAAGISPSVLDVADLERDEVIKCIPVPKRPPPDFDPSQDQWLANLIDALKRWHGSEIG